MIFSNIRELFQPVVTPKDGMQAQPPHAVRKVGDDHQGNKDQKKDQQGAEEDVMHFSIEALRALLTVDDQGEPLAQFASAPDTSSPAGKAVAAYQRTAQKMAPPPREEPEGSLTESEAVNDLLTRLAALEKSGLKTVAVRQGQSVADAVIEQSSALAKGEGA